jgi:hypothetical protein
MKKLTLEVPRITHWEQVAPPVVDKPLKKGGKGLGKSGGAQGSEVVRSGVRACALGPMHTYKPVVVMEEVHVYIYGGDVRTFEADGDLCTAPKMSAVYVDVPYGLKNIEIDKEPFSGDDVGC